MGASDFVAAPGAVLAGVGDLSGRGASGFACGGGVAGFATGLPGRCVCRLAVCKGARCPGWGGWRVASAASISSVHKLAEPMARGQRSQGLGGWFAASKREGVMRLSMSEAQCTIKWHFALPACRG